MERTQMENSFERIGDIQSYSICYLIEKTNLIKRKH